MKHTYKRFRVPNFDIKIKPHELLIINTPTFQRLALLKQLGLAYLVYPHATHTRYAHSLDCLDMAQKIMNSLIDNDSLNDQQNAEDIELIRASALLHDITHIPFSHTLEDETGVLPRHDKGMRIDIFLDKIKEEIVTAEGHQPFADGVPTKEDYEKAQKLVDSVRLVQWTMAGEDGTNPKKPVLPEDKYYIADIVGNTISADLLAYIKSDVEHTGIEKRHGGYRAFDYFELGQDQQGRRRLVIRLTKAGVRHDVISAILDILDVRYALTERVIFHHAKCAAGAMLGKVASLCDLGESPELYSIGDEGLFELLAKKIQGLPEQTEDGRPYKDAVSKLLQNLRRRQLHKRVFKVTVAERQEYDRGHEVRFAQKYHKPENRKSVEESIERKLGLDPGSVILFCPLEKASMKAARVMVTYDKVRETGKGRKPEFAVQLRGDELKADYPDIHARVKNVEDQYLSLWNLYVFLDPESFAYAYTISTELVKRLEVRNDVLLTDLHLSQKEGFRLGQLIESEEGSLESTRLPQIYKTVLDSVARASKESDATNTIDQDTVRRAVEEAYKPTTGKTKKLFPDSE